MFCSACGSFARPLSSTAGGSVHSTAEAIFKHCLKVKGYLPGKAGNNGRSGVRRFGGSAARKYVADWKSVRNDTCKSTKPQQQSPADMMWSAYNSARIVMDAMPQAAKVDPRGVFATNELNLGKIEVYGFDYDYTLAVYTVHLNALIYDLAIHRLIRDFKYPENLKEIPYDPTFATRGLHFDVKNCLLMKLDAFSQIQSGTVYRGRVPLTDEQVRAKYSRFSVPWEKLDPLYRAHDDAPMHQLIDLFTMPWIGLLSTCIEYFDIHGIHFDANSLYQDVERAVGAVHTTVSDDLPKFVHKNDGLQEFLQRLFDADKTLFVVSNSPFSFISLGMTYMLGDDWRKYFKYVVCNARKPGFFKGSAPFRIYDPVTDALSYAKVTQLQAGGIYSGGNITQLSEKGNFADKGVLYFGDHIYTDLLDPTLTLGWNTGAIVPELAREIRIQNTDEYRAKISWLQCLTSLMEAHHADAEKDDAAAWVREQWLEERRALREDAKKLFNRQFGSMFRTYHNMSYFSRRLLLLADVYTSRLPNFLKYGTNHTFYPRRYALPHEGHSTIPNIANEEWS